MAFKLSPSAKAFANRAKEVWRSTHLVIKALPFVGALSLVYFNSPVNVERSRVQTLSQQSAKEMMMDNWARTDPIISKAAAGELSGKEYADHLNQMYWFDTHSSTFGSNGLRIPFRKGIRRPFEPILLVPLFCPSFWSKLSPYSFPERNTQTI